METQMTSAILALIVVGLIAFIVMTYFIIQALIAFKASLARLDLLLMETEFKLKKLDSFMNAIGNVSDIAEKETDRLKTFYAYKEINREESNSDELANWLVSSIKIGVKLFNRR